MKRLSSKLAAFLLVAVMAVSLFPLSALADDAEATSVATEQTVAQEDSEKATAETTTPDVDPDALAEEQNGSAEDPVANQDTPAEVPAVEETPVVVETPVEEQPVVEEPVIVDNTITSQPTDAVVAPNKTAVFEVEAYGKVSSYKWQYSKDGGITWSSCGSNKSSYSVKGTTSKNGYKYRCVVTFKDKKKTQVTSDVAALYVGKALSFKSTKSKTSLNAEVSVKAPEATFPAGTTMEVTDVDAAAAGYIDAINDAVEGTVGDVTAVDISFKYKDEEIEPANGNQVTVTLKSDAVNEGVTLVHIDDYGNATAVKAEDIVSIKGGEVVFKTDAFSVYAVVDPGEGGDNARIALNFYNYTDRTADPVLIKTIYVKNADYNGETDEDNLKTIVFDPGAGTKPDGFNFLGWTTDQNYTAESTRQTIEGIRNDVKARALDNTIVEGQKIDYYAAIYKIVDVTYLGDQGVALGTDAFLRTPNDPEYFEYTVNMSYSPDATHNFEGWSVKEGGNNIANYSSGDIYENEDEISIKGSVVFTVNAPEGQWLVFHENKGSYIAPQFVYSDGETEEPAKRMERTGYSFTGWYADEACTERFNFGGKITERTHVYAGWDENETAPYMVICWTENQNRNGYEVAHSWVNENGAVGQYISYGVVDNGDEDYATGVGTHTEKDENDRDIIVANGHYTGFSLTEASKNQQVEITPEGDAVLNLYFDRIYYNLKFYLYRTGAQNNRYDYANNSGPGPDYYVTNDNGLVTWHTNQTEHPSVTGTTIHSETVGGRTYYYFTIGAYYGDDISESWPKYTNITGANGYDPVSFVMMVGTKLKPTATREGSGTVKGIVSVMNENILGATNNSNGNYLVIRFPNNYNNWRYHIWFETVDGETYPAGSTHTYEGKTYYQVDYNTATPVIDPMEVRSSNTDEKNQNEPKYSGFDYVQRMGQNNQGVWQASRDLTNTDENGHPYGNAWTTGNNNNRLYHLNYIYNRQVFKITYFDGNYVGDTSDGEFTIQNKAGNIIDYSSDIAFGAVIADEWRNYRPTNTPEGYEFEGWYLDEGCTVRYRWGTMPLGGIKVYAKWHRIQYRVFLHPNAGDAETTPELDWGSESQQMNFRVDYLGTISSPYGIRDGYEFVGWFTESGAPFNDETKLTNDNTVAYDKTKDMTDPMDKWGNGATENGDVNRFWINKKLDLYGKWRSVIDGAEGIGVIYDLNGGTGEVKDNTLYKDTAHAFAQNAPETPPEGMHFDHWVLQTWVNGEEEAAGEYVDTDIVVFPGDDFEVLKKDAKVVVTEWRNRKDISAATSTEGTPAIFSGADDITGPEGFQYISQATYTIQLKAVYIEDGTETPTHITWYDNYTPNGDNDPASYKTDPDLQINEAVAIEPANLFTRPGYKFIGWARVETTDDQGTPISNYSLQPRELTEEDLYLKYVDASTTTVDGEEVTVDAHFETTDDKIVTEVAADEVHPYHDMYAVWEKNVFYIYHSFKGTLEAVDMSNVNENGKYDLTSKVSDGAIYGGYYKTSGAVTNENIDIAKPLTLTANEMTVPVKGAEIYTGESLKNGSTRFWTKTEAYTLAAKDAPGNAIEPVKDTVYYLKEVPNIYLETNARWVYDRDDNNKILNIYLLTVIDDSYYNSVGYTVITEDKVAKVVTTFSYQERNSSTINKITPDGLIGRRGYIGVVDATANISDIQNATETESVTVLPFWVTLDGVLINTDGCQFWGDSDELTDDNIQHKMN